MKTPEIKSKEEEEENTDPCKQRYRLDWHTKTNKEKEQNSDTWLLSQVPFPLNIWCPCTHDNMLFWDI